MSFKWWVPTAVLAAVLVCACAEEDRPYATPANVKVGGNTQCLSNATDTAREYFSGKLGDNDIVKFWDCAGNAISMFKKHVKGREETGFSAVELRAFMHKFFLGEIYINDALLSELMEVKRLFVGGDNQSITHSELTRTLKLLKVFESITLRLRPHLEVLFPSDGKGFISSADKVSRSIKSLQDVFAELGKQIERNDVSYDFINLSSLLRELEALFVENKGGSTLSFLVKWSSVLPHMKNVFVGPPLASISSDQWHRSMATVGDAIGLYVRFSKHIKGKDWTQGLALELSVDGLEKVLRMLDHGVGARSGGLPVAAVDGLIQEVVDKSLIPEKWTGDILQYTWRLATAKLLARPALGSPIEEVNDFVKRALRPRRHRDESAYSLTREKIAVLKGEIANWSEGQRDINSGAIDANVDPGCSSEGEPAGISPGATELLGLTDCAPWVLTADSMGRVRISHAEGSRRHDQKSWSKLNWIRSLFRNLIATYSTSKDRRDNLLGLSPTELARLYVDIKPQLIFFGIVDEANNRFHKKIYFEGNLFVPQSNGNHLLEFEEATEYFVYALSGLSIADDIFEKLENTCPIYREEDTGARRMGHNCFSRQLQVQFSVFYGNLPNFSLYVEKLNEDQWGKLFADLEATVREPEQIGSPVSVGEALEVSVLLQFIETFTVRFDQNADGKIDRDEAVRAYSSVYGSQLEKLLESFLPILDIDNEVQELFTYLLKRGRFPDFEGDWSAMLEFLTWIRFPEEQRLAAKRADLARVLSVLNQQRN